MTEEKIVTEDLKVDTSEETRDEAEIVMINVEPIILVSDDDDSKNEKKKARKRQWRADAPKNKICDMCNKAFKTNAELVRHKRSHTGEKPFTCAECGNSYSQLCVKEEEAVQVRMRKKDRYIIVLPQDKKTNATLTYVGFELAHLQMHTIKHHNKGLSKTKNIQCEECSSTFYRKSELDRHMKTHTGDKPFKCEICSKRFTQKNNLVMHVKVHVNDRPHECAECGKRFIARSKMLRHMQKHSLLKKKSFLHMAEMLEVNYDDK